jgi:hypothetical protein
MVINDRVDMYLSFRNNEPVILKRIYFNQKGVITGKQQI